MLDAKTLQWLEDRDALQFMFGQYTLPDGEVSFDDDYRDAAEFEARVQKALMYQYEKAYQCKDVSGGFLPSRSTMLMYARLDVEREMIAEGKGPGRKNKE